MGNLVSPLLPSVHPYFIVKVTKEVVDFDIFIQKYHLRFSLLCSLSQQLVVMVSRVILSITKLKKKKMYLNI